MKHQLLAYHFLILRLNRTSYTTGSLFLDYVGTIWGPYKVPRSLWSSNFSQRGLFTEGVEAVMIGTLKLLTTMGVQWFHPGRLSVRESEKGSRGWQSVILSLGAI